MLLRSGKRKQVAESPLRNVRTGVKRPKKETPKKLKITGLDDDCLEHVFSYLNATDLTNVAEAHPQFVPSARLAYKRKYATKTVRIYSSGLGLSVQDEKIGATVTVFMGNFGDLLRSLSLDYSSTADPNDHFWREIERIIFKYCSKTLTAIELKNCRVNVMEEIRKPFGKVKILSLTSGTIDQSSIRLSKLFPNVDILELVSVDIQNPVGINEKFHFLRSLWLGNLRTVDSTTETVARGFLQSHRNIENLFIDFENAPCNPEFLLFLSTTLTRLKYLLIVKPQFSPVETQTNIHFKRMKGFLLDIQSNAQMLSNLSISFDQLLKLGLYGVDLADTMWRDFILRNSNLMQLGLGPIGNIGADDLLYFVRNLPELNELGVRAVALSPDELMTFLKCWRPLDKLEKLTLLTNFSDELKEYHDAINANFKHKFQTTMEMGGMERLMNISRKTT